MEVYYTERVLTLGRVRIIAVTVTVANTAVTAVNDQFASLVPGDVTAAIDGFTLSFKGGRSFGVPRPADAPLFAVTYDVLILTSHDEWI